MKRLFCILAAATVVATLGSAQAAQADGVPASIPAGFDLFETDPSATNFNFTASPIPADFFVPGSAPFSGEVVFAGEPLGQFQGKDVGDADTIVQRQGGTFAPMPQGTPLGQLGQAIVPIEIVALNLVSVEPIQVQVKNSTEVWNVSATISPTQPSQGHMRVGVVGPAGGTFDSQLTVIPKFTFTGPRNQTKVLDVGEVLPLLGPNATQGLTFEAQGTPWTPGCVLPALSVAGLNDLFCPGFGGGKKVLTVEQAAFARHGVYPAQPRLEHFKCYDVISKTKFKPRKVKLTDQFGTADRKVVGPWELCNPVQKNNEVLLNTGNHLKCYYVRGGAKSSRPTVAIRNQFGSQRLSVREAVLLCLPSAKQKGKRPPKAMPNESLTDHFQCYTVKPSGQSPQPTVNLKDQFDREVVKVMKPVLLCAPTQKDNTPSNHPVQHLVCYSFDVLKPKSFKRLYASTRNQFGTETLLVTRPRMLCVPSSKFVLTK